jgi:hypothetical protein
MSRCTLFLAVLPSGTGWKNSRGGLRSGSTTAARHSWGGIWLRSAKSSHDESPAVAALLVVQRERPEERHHLEVVHVERHRR